MHTGCFTDDICWPTLWVCKLKALWIWLVNEVDGLIVTHHSRLVLYLDPSCSGRKSNPFWGERQSSRSDQWQEENRCQDGTKRRDGCVFSLVIGRVLYILHYMQQMFTGPLAMEKPTVDSLYFFSLSLSLPTRPRFHQGWSCPLFLSLFISLCVYLSISFPPSLAVSLRQCFILFYVT